MVWETDVGHKKQVNFLQFREYFGGGVEWRFLCGMGDTQSCIDNTELLDIWAIEGNYVSIYVKMNSFYLQIDQLMPNGVDHV